MPTDATPPLRPLQPSTPQHDPTQDGSRPLHPGYVTFCYAWRIGAAGWRCPPVTETMMDNPDFKKGFEAGRAALANGEREAMLIYNPTQS